MSPVTLETDSRTHVNFHDNYYYLLIILVGMDSCEAVCEGALGGEHGYSIYCPGLLVLFLSDCLRVSSSLPNYYFV